jgi:hypothetical protein
MPCELRMTKSECIYAILKVFFGVNKPPKDFERIRERAIKIRRELL